MNKFQKILSILIILISLIFANLSKNARLTFAQIVTAHVRIVGSERTIWFGDISTEGCTVTDKDGKQHLFSQPAAICGLDKAADIGGFTYTVSDFGGSLGLFLEGIAEDVGKSDFSTYWVYDVNNEPASEGASNYIVKSGDLLFFHFEDTNADPNQRAINDGTAYLRSQQQDNGGISGFSGVTSWSIMAFAAAGINPDTLSKNGLSPVNYLANNIPDSESSATTWERDILAITAAGKNPYNFNGANYVSNLESYFNNNQLGNTSLVNDDIFGLIALIAAGENSSLDKKEKVLAFILSQQLADGGFSWSVGSTSDTDTTAAAIQALVSAEKAGINNNNLNGAITKAQNFLKSLQNADGGFPYLGGDNSNTATSAWATMAINALGINGEVKDKANTFIRNMQEENGSFKWQTSTLGETFTTSYAIIALSGNKWPIKVFATPSPTITPSPSVTVKPVPTVTEEPSATPTPNMIAKPREQYLLNRLRKVQDIRNTQKRFRELFRKIIAALRYR